MLDVDTNQPYIIRVPNALSESECNELITRIERIGPEIATINTLDGVKVNRNIRNNDRVIFEDKELADTILERVRHRAPQTVHGMTLSGANERFRCHRYKPGMKFAPHTDASFHRNDIEQSWYSCLVYLNDECEGGETTFLTDPEVAVRPETGLALLFQHPIVHEGSIVKNGVKYVCRTDLMYRRESVC